MLPEGQPRSGLRAVWIDANVQLGEKPRSGRPTGLCDIAHCPVLGLISGHRQVRTVFACGECSSSTTSSCSIDGHSGLDHQVDSLWRGNLLLMDIGTLSVVVPVYNEEDYIAGCLESLSRQGDEILEIIVVDNNSTDRTPEIVRSFEQRDSRVRYLVEPRQGVVYARNAGFDIAVGEFIGRVDADSRVAPGWARAVRSSFASHDLDAVTGFSMFYESPFSGLQRAAVNKAEARGDFHGIKPAHALTGSNMAIRATSWRSIRDKVSDRTDIHEDVDLSLCLVKAGMQFGTDLDMRSEISGRRGETGPIEFLSYNRASVTTLEYHQAMTTRLRLMILKTSILHALLWPAYRMYDRQTDRLSWRKLLSGSGARTMPVDS